MIEIRIEPRSAADFERLRAALVQLTAGDPALVGLAESQIGTVVLTADDELGGSVPKEYVPDDYAGSVIGDLNSRRGQVQGTEMRGNATVVNAMVPLANMFGYVDTLRSMSQGRAQYTMQFDHYRPVAGPDDDEPFPPAVGMRAVGVA